MFLASLIQHLYPYGHGRKKLLRWLRRRSGRITVARCDLGFPMLLDRENYIDGQVLQYGGFDSGLIVSLGEAAARAGATIFLDVGANIGLYSIALAAVPGLERIIAFEPDPRNFAQSAGNLFLSGLADRVELRREALSDRAGRATFYVNRTHTGQSGFAASDAGALPITVETARLDDLLDVRARTIAVKIDVEGFESQVLAGMNRLASDNRILLQVEIFAENVERVHAQLRGMGFALKERLAERGHDHDYVYANF